jgi:hypothetical protein
MRRDTKQEFEILRTHMGYEEETDTKFTVAGDRLFNWRDEQNQTKALGNQIIHKT